MNVVVKKLPDYCQNPKRYYSAILHWDLKRKNALRKILDFSELFRDKFSRVLVQFDTPEEGRVLGAAWSKAGNNTSSTGAGNCH